MLNRITITSFQYPTEYPALFYPEKVIDILNGTPPQPSLVLATLPAKPSPPQKPEPPVFNEQPPKRINYTFLGFATLAILIFSSSVASANFVIGLLLFLLLGLGTVGIALEQYKNYPQRLKRHQESKIQHSQKIQQFKKQVLAIEQNYKSSLQNYEYQKQQHERENEWRRQQHRQQCEALKHPQAIEQWRKSQLASIVLYASPLQGFVDVNDFDPRGYAEFESNCQFPQLLKRYFEGKIFVLRKMGSRIPDFAYVDEGAKLNIDIEIDEPYTPRQYPRDNKPLKLTHCLGQDDYDQRTRAFQCADWFVLFFSERQVLQSPHQCCKAVAQVIDFITESTLTQTHFKNITNLKPEARWTEEQARLMAQRQERLHYRTKDIDFQRQLLWVLSQDKDYVPTPNKTQPIENTNNETKATDKKAKKMIVKKYKTYLIKHPEIIPCELTARQFLEGLLSPERQGIASQWLRVKGLEAGLELIKNYKLPVNNDE